MNVSKSIRSSSWTTDMMIGFPDGLLLILFSTQLLHSKPLTVQGFYNIQILILVICTILWSVAVYRVNKVSEEEMGKLSEKEKQKLENLELSPETIHQIEGEMMSDQAAWEATLIKEQVQLQEYQNATALRSMLMTGFFFALGGIWVLFPYFVIENFTEASWVSLTLTLAGILIFSLLKARTTHSKWKQMLVRYAVTGGLIICASRLISNLL
jgi:VIT1/CCC1 family predicted Fe2+/Mn2+ transporter